MIRKPYRYLSYFFALSLLLHLLLVYLSRPPAPSTQVRLFYQQRTTFFDPIQPFHAAKPYQPPTKMERIQAPEPTRSPEEAAVFTIPLAALLIPLPPLPDLPDTILAPCKADFQAPATPMPDLADLADRALRQKIAERETYARMYFDDADTTDEESRRRRRAEAIVERAIGAMGGRQALLAMGELRARVWLEAWEHVIRRLDRTIVHNVDTYLYPIVTWQYRGFDFFHHKSIQVKPSFDPDQPNPTYLTRNPAISQDRFRRLFEHRWLFLSGGLQTLRQQGEVARWHFVERFLGHGVVLDYIGAEHFDRQMTEVIRVDDRRYGHFFEAFFSQRTGLLIGTREGLVSAERRRYGQKYQMQPPVWTTTYTKHRPVQGLVLPHRLTRSGPSCPHCQGASCRSNGSVVLTIQLQIALNGREPDPAPPDLEY